MKPAPSFHGLLVIDKPSGMTSRDVVNRVQGWFPRGVRIGHTGTLDPLATGILVLCLGQATRLAEYVQRMRKTYRAEVALGARSDTDDAEGTLTPVLEAPRPDRATVLHQLATFLGEIDQAPPAFSAAHVTGQRAYDLARRGLEVEFTPRRVHVYSIEMLAFDYPRLDLEVHCGKGTYIRSLARDLGDRLGCGGYIRALCRTRLGPFGLTEAISLEADAATARAQLLSPAAAVAELPRLCLPSDLLTRLRHGQRIPLPADLLVPAGEVGGWDVAVFDAAGKLAAIATAEPTREVLIPAKVLSGSDRASSSM